MTLGAAFLSLFLYTSIIQEKLLGDKMIRDIKEAIAEVKWLLSCLEDDLYDCSSCYSEQHQDSLKDLLVFLNEQDKEGVVKNEN